MRLADALVLPDPLPEEFPQHYSLFIRFCLMESDDPAELYQGWGGEIARGRWKAMTDKFRWVERKQEFKSRIKESRQ